MFKYLTFKNSFKFRINRVNKYLRCLSQHLWDVLFFTVALNFNSLIFFSDFLLEFALNPAFFLNWTEQEDVPAPTHSRVVCLHRIRNTDSCCNPLYVQYVGCFSFISPAWMHHFSFHVIADLTCFDLLRKTFQKVFGFIGIREPSSPAEPVPKKSQMLPAGCFHAISIDL